MDDNTNDDLTRLFDVLTNAQVAQQSIEAFAKGITIQEVKNRDTLVKNGDDCNYIFFILKGGFVCRYYSKEVADGQTIDIFLPENHPFMTCIDSFLNGEKTSLELRALSDSKVAAFKLDELQTLMANDLNLYSFINSILFKSFLGEIDFRVKLVTLSALQLYCHILETNPLIVQQVPSRYIAEFIGVSPEWLAKIKARIQNS